MGYWTEIDNNILDPAWYATQAYHESFRKLRDEDPVHWTENDRYGRHHWTLTRYEDVKEYLLAPAQFSSRWDTRAPSSPRRRTPEERHAQGWDVSVSSNDNPLHDIYRRPLNKHFSAPAIAKLADDIESIVDGIIGEIAGRGSCDLVDDITAQLPMQVIMHMLGVPEEDWAFIQEATSQWRNAADPRWTIDGDYEKTYLTGLTKVMDYCTELAIKRRKEPRDDFSTLIGNLEVDGDPLSIHEMQTWFSVLIGAGLETTRNTASVGLWQLMRHPDQARLLREEPGTIKCAIDEMLRWCTPSKTRLRICVDDMEFHGKRLRRGDWVIGLLASANRDERVFDDPHRFDITRTPNEHLSWGNGLHMCLGRNLARLELATLIPRVMSTFPDIAPASDDEPAWIPDTSVTGFSTLPVTYTPVDYSPSAAVGA